MKDSPDGTSHVAMAISDALLDSHGSIEHGAIAGLVERAAIVACAGSDGEARVTNVSVSFVKPSHARQLVARASRSGAAGTIMHAVITIHETDNTGPAVASGIATVSVETSGT